MSSEPRRLHPAVLALEILSSLRSWFGITSIPWLFVLFRDGFDVQRFGILLVIIFVTLAISAIWGLLSWRATVYGIHGGAFYFKRGVLSKSERTIPLEHIQAVDQVQGVVQRLFNVVEVR
ncbi:MAG: PH domain-containing protein, partial [Chloroflexota bacterium]|nr:PH domain-containing protein [Chloroflexota bacterium]